jgi:hypothetical protein
MNEARVLAAIQAFDRANAEDPNHLVVDGEERPKELVHAERLAAWVDLLDANASEPLRLAARCQHICRWKTPRTEYPEGRKGYIQWRTGLQKFHAQTAAEILQEVGFDEAMIQRVQRINMKKGLGKEHDTQVMEDALCLSFLAHEFDEFMTKHSDEKLIDIVAKTWRKMSTPAKDEALQLKYSERAATLIKAALSESQAPK